MNWTKLVETAETVDDLSLEEDLVLDTEHWLEEHLENAEANADDE